jgi:hypothetical protein
VVHGDSVAKLLNKIVGDDAAFTSPGFSNDEDLPVAKLKAEALHGIFGMDASGGLRQHTA